MTIALSWPGKRTPEAITPAHPLLIETFEPLRLTEPGAAALLPRPPTNALYHGDNLTILAHLVETGWSGKVRVIYADPPYDSGVTWERKVRLRGPRPQGRDPIVMQQAQYTDTWPEGAYLQFIYERLPLLRELLADDGSLWLHCDHRRAHHLRCLLDEVFGAENYLNTITWRSQPARGAKVNAFYFPNSAHTILVYARRRAAPTRWRPPRKRIVLTEAEAEAEFMRDAQGFFRTSDPGAYSFASLARLHAEGRLYAPYGGEVVVDAAAQRVFASRGGNLGVKYYLAHVGRNRYQVERGVDNVWDDIPGLGTTPGEDLGYPTQKTMALLERILATASDPGDLVLDPFCGSGTTPAVAARLGRAWLACDANYGAIQTTTRRLYALPRAFLPTAAQPDRPAHTGGVESSFAIYTTHEASRGVHGKPDATLSITRNTADPATIALLVQGVRVPILAAATAHLPDLTWPALVDCIAIDPAYDGRIFRATMADAPLKKRTTVTGRYLLAAPATPTTIGVRIMDIAGGEQIVTARFAE